MQMISGNAEQFLPRAVAIASNRMANSFGGSIVRQARSSLAGFQSDLANTMRPLRLSAGRAPKKPGSGIPIWVPNAAPLACRWFWLNAA
ncbi:hypothetical protein [Bradyrhizobium sp. BR 10289]|uniref:hypothetical protein n=1 Tax=Bradyrhizobium sp. BR 10289 TaxID=2749993 RepID=UPI001C64DBBB|nr:hypothetical protein [Bradyrhizobium sp. BR 10289]MBW7972462.1 hypothetical protein [Bradyrhizobium sp. BR 10289]